MAHDPFHPRKSGRQSRARETIDAILQASSQIVTRHGLARMTTNHIAEAAGVSIGSLYQYFPGKDAILQALLEREFTRSVDGLIAQIETIDPRTSTLDEGIAVVVDRVLDDHVPRRALYSEVLMAVLSFKHLRFMLDNDARLLAAVGQKLGAYEDVNHDGLERAMAVVLYALKGVQFGLLFSDRLSDDRELRKRLGRLVRALIV